MVIKKLTSSEVNQLELKVVEESKVNSSRVTYMSGDKKEVIQIMKGSGYVCLFYAEVGDVYYIPANTEYTIEGNITFKKSVIK